MIFARFRFTLIYNCLAKRSSNTIWTSASRPWLRIRTHSAINTLNRIWERKGQRLKKAGEENFVLPAVIDNNQQLVRSFLHESLSNRRMSNSCHCLHTVHHLNIEFLRIYLVTFHN